MDIKQYIESGILESYVLGGATSQEIREVECLSSIYPEIKTELTSIQEGMEEYIKTIAVTPPPEIKARVMSQINKTKQESPNHENNLRVIKKSDHAEQKRNNSGFYKIGIAASIITIVGLFAYQFNLNQKLNSSHNELAKLKEINESNSTLLIDSLNKIKGRENLIASSTTNTITLNGTDVSPESSVRVFWNKNSSEIVITQDNLPNPSEDKQYQLWGLVDGAPVSLGMLDKKELISEVRKISLEKVDAFAITLEKNGGSPTPNLEQLFVIGNT